MLGCFVSYRLLGFSAVSLGGIAVLVCMRGSGVGDREDVRSLRESSICVCHMFLGVCIKRLVGRTRFAIRVGTLP
jgi:hypothetical protein